MLSVYTLYLICIVSDDRFLAFKSEHVPCKMAMPAITIEPIVQATIAICMHSFEEQKNTALLLWKPA